jgi:hypoxanthine phosphoribosyltransferase
MSLRQNIEKILFSEDEIRTRAQELGAEITRDYEALGSAPVVIALLRGSVPFLTDLIKYIDLDIQYDFMDVTSYSGTRTTGDIKILKDLDTSVVGRDVLIVEDIVDSGYTIHAVRDLLMKREARTVKVVSLLNKPGQRIVDENPEYVGFEVGNEFVVGYGMDFNQHYRCLPFIGVLKEECYR